MKYVSTRGGASASFEEALLQGLAPGGGLYVPESWPGLRDDWREAYADAPYAQIAAEVATLFGGDAFTADEWAALMADAYAGFDHPDVAPLRELESGLYLLELWHGPTCAFKDFAMQVLARAFDKVLARRGLKRTIVVATSGDTGAAAVEALKGMDNLSLVVMHPKGRISDVQRRQMTTCTEDNVHNLAVEGTFDDCQTIVKALFADTALAQEIGLGAVNSINWVRIVAQVPYYLSTAARLGAVPAFSVPTGNFGDIFAGYVGQRMGLETGPMVIATNANDILHRTLETGTYAPAPAQSTYSPAMDIQISSNFERLLFEAVDRNADGLKQLMDDLKAKGEMMLPRAALTHIRTTFRSASVSDECTSKEIARAWDSYGVLIDPHTAVGLRAARERLVASELPAVVLSTAHPAKFPDTVAAATGETPALPARLAAVMEGAERCTDVPASAEAVKSFLKANLS